MKRHWPSIAMFALAFVLACLAGCGDDAPTAPAVDPWDKYQGNWSGTLYTVVQGVGWIDQLSIQVHGQRVSAQTAGRHLPTANEHLDNGLHFTFRAGVATFRLVGLPDDDMIRGTVTSAAVGDWPGCTGTFAVIKGPDHDHAPPLTDTMIGSILIVDP